MSLQRLGINFVAQNQVLRSYAFKSDLKTKWVRSEKACFKPEKSGGYAKLTPADQSMVACQQSHELQSADPSVQSLFQLGYNADLHQCKELIKKVQCHPLDYGSMESKLSKMTATIRYYQDHMERNPRDVKIKVGLGQQQIRCLSSATAAVTRLRRSLYCRMYPTILLQPDGSTIRVRYHEPRKIIKLPLDLSTLSEAERKARLEARKPRKKVKVMEEVDDNFNAKKYMKYMRKK